ncbi:hypothetical protein PFISCL1PPCAC_2594, partial [Pristionchus fissidentatus]
TDSFWHRKGRIRGRRSDQNEYKLRCALAFSQSTPITMTSTDASGELKQKYMDSIPNAKVWNNYIWPGAVVSTDHLTELQDAEFGPNDVILVSYPKSGTTWCSEVLSGIVHEGDTELIKTIPMLDRVPWLDLDPALVTPIAKTTSPKKRIYFTHLAIDSLPKSAKEGKCKVIYVARNPKDQAVSYYHFHRSVAFFGTQTDLSWKDYLNYFVTGIICCGGWFEHVLGYWKFAKGNSNVKFIKYEDMKRNLVNEVKALEDFIGVSLNEEQRKKVVAHCSFDSMKNNKMVNKEDDDLFNDKVSTFLRKGIVGDWKNHFTVAQNEQFDELYKEKMEGSGLDFEF